MSISLLIERRDPRIEKRLVPIATDTAFLRYWRDGCQALGLEWIPIFRTGLAVRPEDIPDIVAELQELRGWMQNPSNRKFRPEVVSRVETLIGELNDLRKEKESEVEIYIG